MLTFLLANNIQPIIIKFLKEEKNYLHMMQKINYLDCLQNIKHLFLLDKLVQEKLHKYHNF